MTEEKRQAAIRFVERLSTMNFDGLPVAADFRASNPVSGDISREEYERLGRTIASAAVDRMEFKIEGTTVEGNRVAVEASTHAKLSTGKIYDQHYHFLFEFRDGFIFRLRTYSDTKMAADVLGHVLHPPVTR